MWQSGQDSTVMRVTRNHVLSGAQVRILASSECVLQLACLCDHTTTTPPPGAHGLPVLGSWAHLQPVSFPCSLLPQPASYNSSLCPAKQNHSSSPNIAIIRPCVTQIIVFLGTHAWGTRFVLKNSRDSHFHPFRQQTVPAFAGDGFRNAAI